MSSPRVVADCSNLAYIFNRSYTPVTVLLANHFGKFTMAGVVIIPVCDGHVCPTAKQAANVWIADQEKRHISALQLHSRIREIKDVLLEDNPANESSRADLEKELRSAERSAKINETKSRVVVPPNLDVAIGNELCSRNANFIDGESAGGYVDQVPRPNKKL
jgi:hypothetical protein